MTQAPFIQVREVISSTPWSAYLWDMAPAVKRKCFMPCWSEEHLRRHLAMLQAFGFNSIQVNANPLVAIWGDVDPHEWRGRVKFFCQTARALGMTVSQFVWGAAVADAQSQNPQKFSELDWHQPADRARLEAWYRDQAEWAPYIDRVVTHWVDPGRPLCKDCTLDSVIEQHNAIMAVFRARNPGIRGALSTWFMGGEMGFTYPGFAGPGKLAANGQLDPDTDVVIGLMNFHSDGINRDSSSELKVAELAAIAATGRQAGVWSWYTTDIETFPALHVHTDVLQNYFRHLPPQTRTKLAWLSVDDNFHGLNMQNLYVAGRLMCDPSLDAQALLDEFVTGFVGVSNAPAVAAALRAIEQTRTRSRRYEVEMQDPAWLDQSAAAVTATQRGLKTVKLPPEFQSAWPVTMAPTEYLDELAAHLEAIRQMLVFLKATTKPDACIDTLPQVLHDPTHTAGLEAWVYRKKLTAIQTAVPGGA